MPGGVTPRDARLVSAQTRHIAIDVRIDGEEISGEAGDGMGQPTPFSGWLGLIGALDELITTSHSTGATSLGCGAATSH